MSWETDTEDVFDLYNYKGKRPTVYWFPNSSNKLGEVIGEVLLRPGDLFVLHELIEHDEDEWCPVPLNYDVTKV